MKAVQPIHFVLNTVATPILQNKRNFSELLRISQKTIKSENKIYKYSNIKDFSEVSPNLLRFLFLEAFLCI